MNDRRKFLSEIVMAASAVSFLKPMQAFAGVVNKPVLFPGTLTILHTANLEGQWLSVPQAEKGGGLGGLQKLGREIEEQKQSSEMVLLVHCGSITGKHHEHGSDCLPYYRAIGKLGYDTVTPAMSDLAKGIDSYRYLSQLEGLPKAAQPGTAKIGLFPYKIIQKKGLQIGCTDLLSNRFKGSTTVAAQLNNTAAHIRQEGKCHLLICNVQDGEIDAKALATQSSGVDVLLCANEHLSIYNSQVVKNFEGDEVILSHGGLKGTMLSRMDFNFDESGKRTGFSSQAIFIGAAGESYARTMKRYAISYA